MTKSKKIAAILIVCFVALCIPYFKPVPRLWEQWLKGDEKEYTGAVKFWHVKSDFNGISKEAYKNIFSKYEKNNFGVFVEVESITQEEYIKRTNNGEAPDIISYSKNIFENPNDVLVPIKPPEGLNHAFYESGKVDDDVLGVGFAYDGYVMLLNQDVFYESEIDVPLEVDGVWVSDNVSKIKPKIKDKEIAPIGFYDEGAMLNFFYSGKDDTNIIPKITTMKDFTDGKVGVYICPALEYLNMTNNTKTSVPDYSSYVLNGLTNRVRYVSVLKNKNIHLQNSSTEIVNVLFGKAAQKLISEKAFSISYDNENLEAYSEILLPNVFQYDLTFEDISTNCFSNDKNIGLKFRELLFRLIVKGENVL